MMSSWCCVDSLTTCGGEERNREKRWGAGGGGGGEEKKTRAVHVNECGLLRRRREAVFSRVLRGEKR